MKKFIKNVERFLQIHRERSFREERQWDWNIVRGNFSLSIDSWVKSYWNMKCWLGHAPWHVLQWIIWSKVYCSGVLSGDHRYRNSLTRRRSCEVYHLFTTNHFCSLQSTFNGLFLLVTFNLVVTTEMLRNRGGGHRALHNSNSFANVQLHHRLSKWMRCDNITFVRASWYTI